MPRKIKRVNYHKNFLKRASRLPRKIIKRLKEREHIFRKDVFDVRLRTHKLHGKDRDSWVFWIDYTYRVKFIFLNEGEVLFLDIGTHEIYM